jgi:hypothetical protein
VPLALAMSRHKSARWKLGASVVVATLAAAGCRSAPSTSAAADASSRWATADEPFEAASGGGAWIDCVDVLHVTPIRGHAVANVLRLGEPSSTLRTTARIADLAPNDLQSFCDWQACIRTDGYGHTCSLNDAGWERCRACAGAADCNGDPMSRGDCVALATDATRATCNVGLLQECLIQRSIRGPADMRVTQSCEQSAQACAGQLPGDLTAQALSAQHETDQVAVEEAEAEVALAAELYPDSGYVAAQVASWQQKFATWDGGLPVAYLDGSVAAMGPPDGGPSDSRAPEGEAGE